MADEWADRQRDGAAFLRDFLTSVVQDTRAITEPEARQPIGQLQVAELTSEIDDFKGLLEAYGIIAPQSVDSYRYGVGYRNSAVYNDPRGFTEELPESERPLEERFVDLVGDRDVDPALRLKALALVPSEHLTRDAAEAALAERQAGRDLSRGPRSAPNPQTAAKEQQLREVASELAASVLARHVDRAAEHMDGASKRTDLRTDAEVRTLMRRAAEPLLGHAKHTQHGVTALFSDASAGPPSAVSSAARAIAADPGVDEDRPTARLRPREPGDAEPDLDLDTPTVPLRRRPPGGPRPGPSATP